MRQQGIYEGDRYLGKPVPIPEITEDQTLCGAHISPAGIRWLTDSEFAELPVTRERNLRRWLSAMIASFGYDVSR